MPEIELNELEVERSPYFKNVRLNGNWIAVFLTKTELEEIQKKHIDDSIRLFEEIYKKLRKKAVFRHCLIEATSAIFDKVAPKSFTVINAALALKALYTRKESEGIAQLEEQSNSVEAVASV